MVDFDGGFNAFLARAYGLNGTVQQTYGVAFDPFLNDQNYFISVVTLEELGATGRIFPICRLVLSQMLCCFLLPLKRTNSLLETF